MYNPKWYTKPLAGVKIDPLHPLSRGLVGCWVFNEGGGGRVNDLSGNGNHGTLNNFALTGNSSNWVGSPMGGGLDFVGSGTADFISFGSHSSITTFKQITEMIWVKFNSFNAFNRIISNDAGVAQVPQILVTSGGKLRMYAVYPTPNVSYVDTGALTLTTGKWYQIVMTYDSSRGLNGYVNGDLDKNVAANGEMLSTAGFGHIGGLVGNNLDGVVDQVMVYNRALSLPEIKQLYANPHINFMNNKSWMNPTLYGLGAWKGTKLVAGATGTLTANSANDMVEAGMTLAFKKNCS